MDGKRQGKEVYEEKQEKKKKNKVEEFQLANLARPSQAKIAWSSQKIVAHTTNTLKFLSKTSFIDIYVQW